MNESDVTAVFTEIANMLTERGLRKLDDAAILQQKNGPATKVTELQDAGMVDREAARRIGGLKTETPVRGRRGPKPSAVNGSRPVSSATPAAVPARTWPGN